MQKKVICILLTTFFNCGCGLISAKHKRLDVNKNHSASVPTPTCTNETATSAFQSNIQPSIDSMCKNCHASGNTSLKLSLKNSAPSENRINLKSNEFVKNAEMFFQFISNKGNTSHRGGDQSNNLRQENIEAWLESECDE